MPQLGGRFSPPAVATLPVATRVGQMVTLTTDSKVYIWNGTAWNAIGVSAAGAVTLSRSVLDVGVSAQTRAGRVLTLADFTTLLGVTAPLALYQMDSLNDISGNARTLTNKGSVAFSAPGVVGNVSGVFRNAVATDALYIPAASSTGLNVGTGTWGAWVRTARKGSLGAVVSKAIAGGGSYFFGISANNKPMTFLSGDGSTWTSLVNGREAQTDISDEKWHFVVWTWDGTGLTTYVDGVLDDYYEPGTGGPVANSTSPFNIGAQLTDTSVASSTNWVGRIDEVFVLSEVLSEDQIRLLYCTKIPHTMAAAPTSYDLSIRRYRRGGPLVSGNFPAAPIRLYNFASGSPLTDTMASGNNLTQSGTPSLIAGADGGVGHAYHLKSGDSFSASDASLPVTTRSFGCWFKTPPIGTVSRGIMSYGSTTTSNEIYIAGGTNAGGGGQIMLTWQGGTQGQIVSPKRYDDGLWHFAVAVLDPNAADAVPAKLYVDGAVVASSTAALTTIVLAGAGGFLIGNLRFNAIYPFVGGIDGAFVYNGGLTAEQVRALYAVSSRPLPASPKNVGDHVEGADATNVYCIFDLIDAQNTFDLKVA